MVFDGGADDIQLLKDTYDSDRFVGHLDAYLDLTKQIRIKKRTLYKVQIVESQLKNIIVPVESAISRDEQEGDAKFYVDQLYRDDQPLNIQAVGFSRALRSVSKIG